MGLLVKGGWKQGRELVGDEGQWIFWLCSRGKKSNICPEIYMLLYFVLGGLLYDIILVTFGRLVYRLLRVYNERSFIDQWFLEYPINTDKRYPR